MRTTSSLEAENSTLSRSFPKHPHIFKFIERLRMHEFSKLLDMINLVKKDVPNSSDIDPHQVQRKRKRDIEREKKICECTHRLKTEKGFTIGNFLETMAQRNVTQAGNFFYMLTKVYFFFCI